jgi:predicted ATPase/HPt (histidine-containing phosphotransfer) domain-containing protein
VKSRHDSPQPANAGGIAEEILHRSEGVRVSRRLHPGHRSVIVKQVTGNLASRRLAHESAILERLAEVPGVVKRIAAAEANTLMLADDDSLALDQFLRSNPLDLAQAVGYAHAFACILASVHHAGVIHRDICPANLLIHPQTRRPMLIDFNSAVVLAQGPTGPESDGELVCTWAYMSPEQTGRIGRTPDQRSDLYSLGVTLYELLTARRPFEADDLLELVHDHLVRVPPSPASVNPALPALLSDLILRLLEKEPDRRYQSADGLAQDLKRIHAALLSGTTPRFELGQFDFGARLNPPLQLLGRAVEVAALRDFVNGAADASHRCLLVAGPAGVGKSALLDQIRPLVAARKSWFVYSKFEQYRQDSPDSALHAFRILGRQLLAESAESLAHYRERILQALGSNLGVGPALLPEFELLLGKHPAIELSDPREAEARTVQAGLDLLRSVASPERPLLLIYDDVHWAPNVARRLLDTLVTSPEPIPGLLLIGSYRNSETLANHPLRTLMDRWQSLGLAPQELAVNNLAPDAAGEFVGTMLRLPAHEAKRLAAVLGERTQHNVYDTIELLNALRQDGLLVPNDGHWSWDAAAIRRHVGNTSIADLLNRRIAKLTSDGRELLQIIACLGGQVSLQLLEQAIELDAVLLQRHLEPALNDGLLVNVSGERPQVQFVNGRVQQAVLEGMAAADRTRLHLRLARRLIAQSTAHSDLDALAAEQYLAACAELSDAGERRCALNLFERAAQRLRLLNGAVAERYFAAAIAQLDAIATPQDQDQLYRLQFERHRALFSLGRLEESDALYPWLAANAESPVVLSQSTRIQMYSHSNRRRFGDSLALGLGLLEQMGMVKPADIRPDLGAGFKRLVMWAHGTEKLQDLTRPEASDERVLAWSMIIPESTTPAYFCDPATFAWLNLEALRLWIEYGPSYKLMAGFCAATSLLAGTPQDYRGAYDVGRHLLKVGEARGYEPSTSFTRVMFGLAAAHWVEPIESAAAEFFRARSDLMRRGDESFFAVTFVAVDHVFDYATTLDTVFTELDWGLAVAARTGNVDFQLRFQPRKQMLLALRGETRAPGGFDTGTFDEAAYQQSIDVNGPTAAIYHTIRGLSALFFGDVATLIAHTPKAIALSPRIPGYYIQAMIRVLHAVALAERTRVAPVAERGALVEELDTCLKWLAARAADAPVNFQHLLRWVEAERASVADSIWAAGAAFDAAVQEAALHARPWHRALINERAALFHLRHGLEHSARPFLMDACDIYEGWGATGKVKELRRAHVFLRAGGSKLRSTATSVVDNQVVDMMAVLRASQALSSETSLVRLTEQVGKVLSTLTGATAVRLIVRAEEGGSTWVMANSLGSERGAVTVEAASERGELPLSIFRYVERTGELLVIDDVSRDERCATDAYAQQFDHCSMLLAPILKQGQLSAVLVLENSQRRGAFSTDRLDSVAMIAGQLAVSLDNALLYASLEQRVAERTAQLRHKTDDINAMLQNMPQGVLTVIANGTVHPEYSAYLATILEDNNIAQRNVMELLFTSTSLDADTVDQVEAAIGACLGEDQMNFEFNSHLLVTAFDKTLPNGRVKSLALSWSPICDERGNVDRLMLCVRDVTEIKRLENEANARKRELQMIAEILGVPQEKFHPFIDGARSFLDENRRLVEAASYPREDTTQRLFRNMHTLKGNARTYGLLALTNLVHAAEQSYAELRHTPETPWDRPKLLAELTAVRDMLEAYAHVNGSVLGRKGPGRRGDVERFLMVERSTVQKTLRSLLGVDQSDVGELRSSLRQVAHMLSTLGTQSLATLLAGTLEGLPSLARELGKEPPVVQIDDHDISIRTQASALLRNVFMHLMRNAMDHGIELPARRRAQGKPAAGQIQLRLSVDDGKLWIRLRDDGRGLALAQIRQRALDQGLITGEQHLSREQIAQLVFCAGLSTANQVTEVSGRGVGLDAVKDFLVKDGGSIAIHLLGDATDEFCAFETVIALPDKYAASLNANISFDALISQMQAAEAISGAPSVRTGS